MVDVRDANGVRWAVERKWWSLPGQFYVTDDAFSALLMLLTLLMVPAYLGWPFWFLAKFLGLPWNSVVQRDGQQVGVEYVSGWAASKRRGLRGSRNQSTVLSSLIHVDVIGAPA